MTLLEHRKRRPPLLSLTMALVIALPTGAALLFAYRESLGGFQEIAALMTRQVVLRTDAVGTQMRRGLAELAPRLRGDPCTPAGIALMRETLLRSDMLADVGYARGDRLLCSSFGPQDRPLQQPAFMSRNGYWLRRGVRLHEAMDSTLVAATDPATGLTLFTHENAVLNIIPTDQPWQVAVIGHGVTDTVLAQRGDFDPRWLGRVDSGDSGFFVQAGHLVAWEHSRIGAYTVFAALPYGTWEKSWLKASLLLGSIGLALGVFLASLMTRSIKRSSSLRAQLRRALKGNELFLEYQPVVELASGRWVGAEALMRWRRPTGEIIGPAIFVPIAEKNGFAPELRNRLIELLERDAPPLFARHPGFHLALNFSANDLDDPAGILARLLPALARAGATPRNLIIEITEMVCMDADNASATINALHQAGISIAIDDFGTGYSSLSHLAQLRFDYLKIDKSFVDSIGTASVTRNIIDHIIAMARSLDTETVAEGVETQAQADYLREHGVQFAQGWLYARSMPMGELLARLAQRGD